MLGSHSIGGSRGGSLPSAVAVPGSVGGSGGLHGAAHETPTAAARAVSTQSRELLVGPAPIPAPDVKLDGPLPSLEGLNVCARVELMEDASRGVIYIVMPCANGWGELRTDKKLVAVAKKDPAEVAQKALVETGGKNQSVQFARELSDKSVSTRDLIDMVETGQVSAQDVIQLLNVLEDRKWTRDEIHNHPRFVERCLMVFQSMVNEQLFRVIRGEKGLCYAISFGMSMTDFYESGTANVYCNAFPDEHRLRYTLLEIIKVLQAPLASYTQEDFEAAKTPLIAQEQMDLLTNAGLWLDKMTGLQLPLSNQGNQKRLDETHDLVSYLSALTLEDVLSVAAQYFHPSKENLFVGLGVSHAPDEVVNRSHPHRQQAHAIGNDQLSLHGTNLGHPVHPKPSHPRPSSLCFTAGLRPRYFAAVNPNGHTKRLFAKRELPLVVRSHAKLRARLAK